VADLFVFFFYAGFLFLLFSFFFFSLLLSFSIGFKISNKSKTRLLYAIFYLPLQLNYKHLFLS